MPCVAINPWWLDRIVVPVSFTLFGALLGFISGRLKDRLDDRKAKKVFLKAIRVELSALHEHLDGTLRDAVKAREELKKGISVALHLGTFFQTGIYASQVGKLRDVFDSLVIEVIQFYDKLANLERVKSRLTVVSFELATNVAGDSGASALHYRDTLDEVINRIEKLLPEADALIRKLPGG